MLFSKCYIEHLGWIQVIILNIMVHVVFSNVSAQVCIQGIIAVHAACSKQIRLI